jgi:glucuronosyltransferase
VSEAVGEMTPSMKPVLVLVLAALCCCSEAVRILAVFGMKGKSHTMVSDPLVRALAARGHEVHVYSHYKVENAPANLHFHPLEKSGGMISGLDVGRYENQAFRLLSPVMLLSKGLEEAEAVFSDPKLLALIESKQHFDLLITELFNTECYLGLAHHFQVFKMIHDLNFLRKLWGNSFEIYFFELFKNKSNKIEEIFLFYFKIW